MNYDKIIINPVSLSYLLKQTDAENLNVRSYAGAKEKDDKYVANYFRNTFCKAFKLNRKNRFRLVRKRGYGTLILNIAIVQIVPTKVSFNSATAALSLIPFGSILAGAVFSLVSRAAKTAADESLNDALTSSIAFEAVLKDAMTGKTLIAYADREAQKTTIISFKDYTYFAHIRRIINDWSQQTVEMLNRNGNEKIDRASFFTLNPL